MEDALKQLIRETSKVLKYTKVHREAQNALDFLEQKNNFLSYKPHQIRARCLEAFQTALESKNQRLASFAIVGIQHMLKDVRMHSSESVMKEEEFEQWFPLQVLKALSSSAMLSEDIQVEVMRLLLNMALSLPQSMSAAVVINIIKLCLESLMVAGRQTIKNFVFNTFLRMIHMFSVKASDPDPREVMIEAFGSNSHISINTAVKGTFSQLLSSLNDKLTEDIHAVKNLEEKTLNSIGNSDANIGYVTSVVPREEDFTAVFQYICDNLTTCPGHSSPTEALLLEGILVLLGKLPHSVCQLEMFHDLIWQKLCPSLISILANPMSDKTVIVSRSSVLSGEEVGRGSGCSLNAPAVSSASAKIIYNISVHLIMTVGRYASLRPVFESLFHRMLLYPYPIYRLDAIKSLKSLLSSSEGLKTLCGSMKLLDDNEKISTAKKQSSTDMRLIKIIVDCLQECSHCSDSTVVISSIELINDFLSAIESLVYSYVEMGDTNERSEYNLTIEKEEVPEVNYYSTGSDDQPVADAECSKRLGLKFIEQLCGLVEEMSRCSDILKADEVILKFASQFCSDFQSFSNSGTILNADAVYITAYSTLHLSTVLFNCGYYSSHEKSLPISQDQFIGDILDTGLLLYISKSWLKEVFAFVISSDVFNLQRFNADQKTIKNSIFFTLMNDLDGFNSHRLGGQLLTGCQKDLEKFGDSFGRIDYQQAGHKLAYNILTQCWDGILDVLSVLTSGKGSCNNSSIMLLFNAKEETKRTRQAICASLEGLQKAARLSSVLGLQNRCGSVFAQLASASCVVELNDIKMERLQQMQSAQQVDKPAGKASSPSVTQSSAMPPITSSVSSSITSSISSSITSSKPKLARLHAAHALSMNMLLSIGLEMGSHSSDCWENVFKCCAHILDLEHTYFSSYNENLYSSMTKLQKSESTCNEFVSEDDGIESGDVYLSTSVMATEPVISQINVKQVIEQSRLESGWDINVAGGGVLSSRQASKVLCGLSQEVDRLFDDAATKLNMKSLIGFLTELCRCSATQLSSFTASETVTSPLLSTNALHLYRLGDLMNKCILSKRPLLHIMRAWSVVSQHLTKAACHNDRIVSKKAVACIHEVVTALLSSCQELPYFHFNEFLCKPFENLLCLELCDGDVQDQIVCSICELVEACPCNMKSGWKPLFSGLRAVKVEYTFVEEINIARQRHVAAILDVFNVFLTTDNVLVFANAAVDCILCLLRYVRGPGEFEEYDSDSDYDVNPTLSEGNTHNDLCLPALKYLKQCANYLATMWSLPSCPIFIGANRVHSVGFPLVTMLHPNFDIQKFTKTFQEEKAYFGCLNSRESNADESLWNKLFDQAHVHEASFDKISEEKNNESSKRYKMPSSSDWLPDDGVVLNVESTSCNETECSTEDLKEKFIDAISDNFLYVDAKESFVNDCLCTNLHEEVLNQKTERSVSANESDEGTIEDSEQISSKVKNPSTITEHQAASSSDPLSEIDNTSGVLHVYHLLIGGLTDAVVDCSRNYQPQTLETLFDLIRSAAERPDEPNLLKHLEFMLHQQLAILVNFIAEPVEFLSRLGCSCIRHCLINCGPVLQQNMWNIAVEAMKAACDVTLYNLRCLVLPFHDNSDSFYGDIGQVKVAVRQEPTPVEFEKLRHLSQQVFLLDVQQDQNTLNLLSGSDQKTFAFLIYSPSSLKQDIPIVRIPFKSLVFSLVSHQLLVQTLGSLLLNGTPHIVPSEAVVLNKTSYCKPSNCTWNKSDPKENLALPGMLEFMTCQHALGLLDCLRESFKAAEDFDRKPGLKFLIQKVLGVDVSANMYRHAGLSMTLYVHCLLELVSHQNFKNQFSEEKNQQSSLNKEDVSDHINSSLCPNCRGKSTFTFSCTNLIINGNVPDQPCHFSSLEAARQSDLGVLQFIGVFACLLKETLHDMCSKYVELFLEKEGPSISDRLSQSMLVFLQVENDDLPLFKKEKSLREAVAEKLRKSSSTDISVNNLKQTNLNGSNKKGCKDLHSAGHDATSPPSDDKSFKSVELVDISALDHFHKSPVEDKVYTAASDQTIKELVGEYKKRKQSRSMPSTSTLKSKFKLTNKTEIDPEITKQQRSSFLKDSEAHLRSRAEVLCNVLQLFDQLNDIQYCALLPLIHSCVVQLACNSTDPQLRQSIAQWILRIGRIFKFSD